MKRSFFVYFYESNYSLIVYIMASTLLSFITLLSMAACFNSPAEEFKIVAVDLGLSVKWSNANLGATAPEGAGDYYAWGETQVKKDYSWDTYKWGKDGYNTTFSKYNHLASRGKADYLSRLEETDDVAHLKLGAEWRIPSIDELIELFSTKDNADYRWEWITENGVIGWSITYLVNNNRIFLPAARGKGDSWFIPDDVPFGGYWSSDLSPGLTASVARGFVFQRYSIDINIRVNRYLGLPVRPVYGPRAEFKPVDGFEIEAVDLGLSVKWSNANLGATAPEGYGDFYSWGEIKPKNNYSWKNYKWCNGTHDSLTKYNTSSSFGKEVNYTRFEDSDDVAHVKLGGKWRIPTRPEVEELIATWDNTDYQWEWKTQNGHRGWVVTYLKNGNSIFLPATGIWNESNYYHKGDEGFFWSVAINKNNPDRVMSFHLTDYNVNKISTYRCYGIPVRPVTE